MNLFSARFLICVAARGGAGGPSRSPASALLSASQALSVGIFPYVLKLLQSSARELRPLLVFIWAKILAVDSVSTSERGCFFGLSATLAFEPRLSPEVLQKGGVVWRPVRCLSESFPW